MALGEHTLRDPKGKFIIGQRVRATKERTDHGVGVIQSFYVRRKRRGGVDVHAVVAFPDGHAFMTQTRTLVLEVSP